MPISTVVLILALNVAGWVFAGYWVVKYNKLEAEHHSLERKHNNTLSQLDRYWVGEDFPPPGHTKGK